MLPNDFPTIVCLCGSTRFQNDYINAQRRETLAGKIVLTVGLFGHQEGIDMGGPMKAMLDELHLRKIDLADEILVINPIVELCDQCGKPCRRENAVSDCCKQPTHNGAYIGDSTKREINYAQAWGKTVWYLS